MVMITEPQAIGPIEGAGFSFPLGVVIVVFHILFVLQSFPREAYPASVLIALAVFGEPQPSHHTCHNNRGDRGSGMLDRGGVSHGSASLEYLEPGKGNGTLHTH